ncbi:MAG: serine/threonine-protein phosphatase [Myxococcales bacterium]|nr:serine/threonine-protein phosphatase [Myxococcales bacterium]
MHSLRQTLMDPPRAACDWDSVRGPRHDENEDSVAFAPGLPLAVVADGIGGHNAGSVASSMAVDTLIDTLWTEQRRAGPPGSAVAHALLERAVRATSARVYQSARFKPELRGMGTTLVAVWIVDDEALVVHVGDSRAYHVRDDTMTRLTEDHTLARAIGMDAAQRSRADHVLVQAVGTRQSVEPTLTSVPVQRGDRFLLCTDGVTDVLDDRSLAVLMAKGGEPEAQAARVTGEAVRRGTKDDATALVLALV